MNIESNYFALGDAINRLSVGDCVCINDWDTFLIVRGVSEDYVLVSSLTEMEPGQWEYSIISKQPVEGRYYCAPDFWTFGYVDGYRFDDEGWVKAYLESLQKGETEMSYRNRELMIHMTVKSKGEHDDHIY